MDEYNNHVSDSKAPDELQVSQSLSDNIPKPASGNDNVDVGAGLDNPLQSNIVQTQEAELGKVSDISQNYQAATNSVMPEESTPTQFLAGQQPPIGVTPGVLFPQEQTKFYSPSSMIAQSSTPQSTTSELKDSTWLLIVQVLSVSLLAILALITLQKNQIVVSGSIIFWGFFCLVLSCIWSFIHRYKVLRVFTTVILSISVLGLAGSIYSIYSPAIQDAGLFAGLAMFMIYGYGTIALAILVIVTTVPIILRSRKSSVAMKKIVLNISVVITILALLGSAIYISIFPFMQLRKFTDGTVVSVDNSNQKDLKAYTQDLKKAASYFYPDLEVVGVRSNNATLNRGDQLWSSVLLKPKNSNKNIYFDQSISQDSPMIEFNKKSPKSYPTLKTYKLGSHTWSVGGIEGPGKDLFAATYLFDAKKDDRDQKLVKKILAENENIVILNMQYEADEDTNEYDAGRGVEVAVLYKSKADYDEELNKDNYAHYDNQKIKIYTYDKVSGIWTIASDQAIPKNPEIQNID